MPNGIAWSHSCPPPNPAVDLPSTREIVNGICYAIRSGGAWKLLPHDLPPWRTVYHYFWSWRRQGIWAQIHDTVRQLVRQAAGREGQPSGAVLDSQSVRTSEQAGVRGYDGAKKLYGRKRHLLVDTLGLVLLVLVTGADVQDRDGARTCCRCWGASSGDCA
jgi:putative transposase